MAEDILRQIGMISRSLDSIANFEFKDIKLTRGQYLYLVRIFENPGIISDHLANLLAVDRTTAARSIQKLAKQGLIIRQADQVNKKIRHLLVTEKGQKLAQLIEKENRYSTQMATSGLTKSEVKQLSLLLAKVEKIRLRIGFLLKMEGKENTNELYN